MNKKINSQNMSSDEILSELINEADRIYNKYDYINISKEEYYKLILSELNKIHKNDKTNDSSYYKNIFLCVIKNEVKKELENNNSSYFILNSYINKKYLAISNYDKLMKYLNDLDAFLKDNEFIPNKLVINRLLDENNAFYQMIKIIVDKNIRKIKMGEINYILDNSFLLLTIDCYCIKNNISIKEEIDDDIFDDISDKVVLASDKQYIKDMKKYPKLTLEQEKILMDRIKAGDKEAKDFFVSSNLRLVLKFTKNRNASGLSIMDLIQEGNIGLMTAVDKYDPSKGFKFSTYAGWWIRQAISRAIQDKGRSIRIPVYLQKYIKQFKAFYLEFQNEYGKEPSIYEVANKLNLSLENVKLLYESTSDLVSINEKLLDGEKEIVDMISSDDESLEEKVTKKAMKEQVLTLFENSNLTENEKTVIMYRYGLSDGSIKTLDEIGSILGLTKQRIDSLEERALRKMRKSNHILPLIEFADNPEKVQQKIMNNISTRKSKDKPYVYNYFFNFSKEKVDDVIEKLSYDEKMLIMSDYNLDLFNSPCLDAEEEEYKRKILEIRSKIFNMLNYNNVSIFDFFKNFSEEEVVESLNGVRFRDKEIIEEIKNNNYLLNLSLNDCDYFIKVMVPKINKKLIRNHTKNKVYVYFDNYEKSKVDRVISNLLPEERTLLNKYFESDEQIDNEQEKIKVYDLVSKIKKQLKNIEKTIYSFFPLYTKDEVDKVIMSLSLEDLNLLRRLCGCDLNDLSYCEIDKYNRYDFSLLKGKMNRKLKKFRVSFSEYFEDYDFDEIQQAVSFLDLELQMYVHKAYGDDLKHNNIINLTESENSFLFHIVIPKTRNTLIELRNINMLTLIDNNELEESNTIGVAVYQKALKKIRKPECSFLLSQLSTKEGILGIIKLGYVDGITYSSEAISKMFDVSSEEVEEAARKSLALIKESLNYSEKIKKY